MSSRNQEHVEFILDTSQEHIWAAASDSHTVTFPLHSAIIALRLRSMALILCTPATDLQHWERNGVATDHSVTFICNRGEGGWGMVEMGCNKTKKGDWSVCGESGHEGGGAGESIYKSM